MAGAALVEGDDVASGRAVNRGAEVALRDQNINKSRGDPASRGRIHCFSCCCRFPSTGTNPGGTPLSSRVQGRVEGLIVLSGPAEPNRTEPNRTGPDRAFASRVTCSGGRAAASGAPCLAPSNPACADWKDFCFFFPPNKTHTHTTALFLPPSVRARVTAAWAPHGRGGGAGSGGHGEANQTQDLPGLPGHLPPPIQLRALSSTPGQPRRAHLQVFPRKSRKSLFVQFCCECGLWCCGAEVAVDWASRCG